MRCCDFDEPARARWLLVRVVIYSKSVHDDSARTLPMAPPAKVTLTANPLALEAFDLYHDACLRSITELRSKTSACYSEALCDRLATITKPFHDGVVVEGTWAEQEAAEPVFRWVKAKREEVSDALDSLWQYTAKLSRLDLATAAPRVAEAMRQEREFRFFGLFVPLAARCSKSDEVPLAAPTVNAVRTFHATAEKLLQVNSTLLRDPYLVRALSLQELPVLRFLERVLPGLVETLQTLNVKALYPVRNTDETSFARYVFVELAEMLLRSFGHANLQVLELLAGEREIDVPLVDEKWGADRIAEAREMIDAHALRRGTMDFRYPRYMWDEDYVRPLPGRSFWLGDQYESGAL